jgi:hypothetical protein
MIGQQGLGTEHMDLRAEGWAPIGAGIATQPTLQSAAEKPATSLSETETGNRPQMQMRYCWNIATSDKYPAVETRCLSFVGVRGCNSRSATTTGTWHGETWGHRSKDAQRPETVGRDQILQPQRKRGTAFLANGDEELSRVTTSSIYLRVA